MAGHGIPRTLERLRRHWRWGRTQGFRRLIEEDRLDPITRTRQSLEKRRWRREHDIAPNAVPVFLLGVQRSGTNMLVHGLEEAPEFEVRNENDRRAFEDFRLRPIPVIERLVAGSGHRYVLMKPLCDSHRAIELLDRLATPSAGRAIWAYRSVDGRVRSAVAKFGSANLEALTAIAGGQGDDLWQAGGLSSSNRSLIESLDYSTMSAESAAALFWLIRNSLYFELGLEQRSDVLLVSYEHLVDDPEAAMRRVCAFLELEYRPEFTQHIDARAAHGRPPLVLDPEIRRLCDDLEARLETSLNRA